MDRGVLPQATACKPDAALTQLLERQPTARPEIELLQRCARHLLTVMRGETDPLKLLFPADNSISAGDLYRDSVGGRTMNALVAEAVAQVGQALPDGRTLRILEIGAGTGATTASILQRLPPQRVRYVFTDIAASFLPQAKERFKDQPNIEFRVLDIERDPTSQGFDAHGFDVIIAANVLHATRNLRDSLTHVRRLIAPGGKLIVLEGTRPVRWLDLTFGLTSGWWRFSDSPLRADYPLLSIDAWRRLLDELGWEAIRIIPPFPMSGQDREPESAVIVSQVDEQRPSDNILAHAGASSRWMVFADDQGYGAALVAHLQNALCQPCLSTHITDHLAISDTSPADHSAVGHVGQRLAGPTVGVRIAAHRRGVPLVPRRHPPRAHAGRAHTATERTATAG